MARGDYLYDLLPPMFAEMDRSGQLYALTRILQSVEEELEEGIDRLLGDIFVETCSTDKLPLLARLLGIEGVRGDWPHQRALVADMVALRRRKGTLAALPAFATAVTGWPAAAVSCSDGGEETVKLTLWTGLVVEDPISFSPVPQLPGHIPRSVFAFHPLGLPVQAVQPAGGAAAPGRPAPRDAVPLRLSPGPCEDCFSLDLRADLALADRVEELSPPPESWPCLAYGPGRAIRLTRRARTGGIEEIPPWELGSVDLSGGELPLGDFPLYLTERLRLDSTGRIALSVGIGQGRAEVTIEAPRTLSSAAADLQGAIRGSSGASQTGFAEAQVVALDGGLALIPGGGRPLVVDIGTADTSPAALAYATSRPCGAARSAPVEAAAAAPGSAASLAVRIGSDSIDLKVDWAAEGAEALAIAVQQALIRDANPPAFKTGLCRAAGDRVIVIGGQAGLAAQVVGRGAAKAAFPSASIWIDPASGLIAMPDAASRDISGSYFRSAPPLGCDLRSAGGKVRSDIVPCANLGAVLADRNRASEILIGEGRAVLEAIRLRDGETLTLAAARPGATALSTGRGLSISAGRGGRLVLRGLLIDGPVSLLGEEASLDVEATTMRPGAAAPKGRPFSILAEGTAMIRLSRSIVGSIAAGADVVLEASDTVLGMNVAPGEPAVSGLPPEEGGEAPAGGRLRLDRVTLLAAARAVEILSVKDSLVARELVVSEGDAKADSDREGLTAAAFNDAPWPSPHFAQLVRQGTPPAALRPTEDGGDRGAYHRAEVRARFAALRRALPTMLPIAAPAITLSIADWPDEPWTAPAQA